MARKIVISDFNLGGIADSDFQGVSNSLAKIVGFDLHSKVGVAQVSNRVSTDGDSASVITEDIGKILPCSDGKIYYFSKESGKIYKKTSGTGNTFTLVHTNTQGTCLDAEEFDGYIYYACAGYVGRWQIGNWGGGSTWSGTNDSYGTFTNSNNSYHPMMVKNGDLYIGDGNLIAQVDSSHAFTANALDIEEKYVVKCLGESETDLLIGTENSASNNQTKIFHWNTWSESWSRDDTVPEDAINAFIPADNKILVQAGNKGNIYAYDGWRLNLEKKIAGDWSWSNGAHVLPHATAYFRGRPIFGLSNQLNNPALQGIYSYAGYDERYPKVLALEYLLSALSSMQIYALAVADDVLLVSSDDGLSRVESSRYASAYLETLVIKPDRINLKNFTVSIPYSSSPTGTSLSLKKKVNYGSWETVEIRNHSSLKAYKGEVSIPNATSLQLRVEPTVSGVYTPEIECIEIDF